MPLRKFLFFLFFLGCSAGILSQEKQIEALKIQGAKKVNVGFLKSILTSKEGQALDSISLEKDIVLLKRLPAISHAYYQVFHSDKNLYIVLIYIEENYTILPNVNLWTTTNNQFSYKLGLYDYNFLGRNITFGGFYQNNGFDSYAINFKAPNLFSKKMGFGFKSSKLEKRRTTLF